MNEPTAHEGGRLVDLSDTECWALAASKPVGRLAWCSPAGPSVVPVNFTVRDQRVHVRTAAYSAIARECDDSPVAFEIDDLDEASSSGWSVLVRGHAHIEYQPGDTTGPQVWPEGTRALHLIIEVDTVTGRRLHSA